MKRDAMTKAVIRSDLLKRCSGLAWSGRGLAAVNQGCVALLSYARIVEAVVRKPSGRTDTDEAQLSEPARQMTTYRNAVRQLSAASSIPGFDSTPKMPAHAFLEQHPL